MSSSIEPATQPQPTAVSCVPSASEPTPKVIATPDFDESLVAAFERVAAMFPSRIALGSDAWEPTYRELNETANRLAHQLIARGIASGDRVATLMSHDAPLIAAVLGILKAGAIVVGLDPGDPTSRLKTLVDDAEPSVVVTDVKNQTLADEFSSTSCYIFKLELETMTGPTENPSIEIGPEQTAFLTYTSGTTGRPKGVMKSHRQLRRGAAIHSEAMQYTENDRIPLFAMISTGLGSTGLWSLLNGAMLCPFPLQTRGVTGLADWIIDRGLTVYVSTSSVFRTLVKAIDDRLVFANVRGVTLQSEAVTSDDFRSFRQHFPKESIFVHALSSSETSNIAWSRWTHADNIPEGVLPVGLFSRGVDVSLLGDDGQSVARGEVGEIVVKSRYLANGYWRDPQLTKERFSADLDGNGTRMLRTGDRGRINTDGLLEFCGRKDDRIKMRGNRVELLDVERALKKLPGIDSVAVVAVSHNNHEPVLIAFVVKKAGASLTASRLRHAARANLTLHMVPSRIVFLNSLPYNKGNKIDRDALRRYFLPIREECESERPQTELEMLVADIWMEIFDLSDIGRDDDFFSLGGDSLSAAIVAARIHASLGIELNLGDIADHPTVAALATTIDDRRRTEVGGLPQIVPVPRGASMPVSLSQELVWNCQHDDWATLVRTYRVIGPLDIEILKECMSYLVDRHEILRTTFGLVDGSLAQTIHPSAPLDFTFIDLIDADDPEDQAQSIFCKHDWQHINLGKLPLVRHILIRVAHENYCLGRVCSHIISDGPSSRLLNIELALLYEARAQSAEPSLPRTPSLQYTDYAAWQRQITRPDSPYFNEVISWWKSLISAASPTAIRLPFRILIRRSGLNPSEGVLKWNLEERTAQRLDQFARSVGATHFTVRLAAFAILVADVTGNSTIVIGTNFANRNRGDTENIVGPVGNMSPLVFSYDATKTFREWLGIVRDRVFETATRSELSYEVVKQQLRAEGIEPLEIEIVFAMLGDHSVQHFGNLTISHEFRSVGKMPGGCQFYLESEKPENCCVHFDAGVYKRNGMRLMLDRYLRLLVAAGHEPELPIGKLLAKTGAKPLRWTYANYAAPFYEFVTAFYASSPFLKMCWRPIKRWVLSGA
jgi:amino acid adenylation domain-containing protein